jgi:hypothetical protein
MGGRGSWSKSGGTFEPVPGGGGGGGAETVLGPRIPESLQEALGEPGPVMSIAQASAGTNPHYNASYGAYSSNCQRCVLTYEARRRGYDVTALPTYSGDLLPSGGDYLRALSNPKTVSVGASVRKLESEMKSYGNGSRAIVGISRGSRGHVFIAENVRGKITYVDPQTNERHSSLSMRYVSNARLTRIDNQSFTDYAKNAFTRQKV